MSKLKQIIRDIKISEALNKELNPLTKKTKEFIDGNFEGLIKFEVEKYPDSIFYKKGDIVLFKQDLKNKRLWCSYEYYWSFLVNEIGLNNNEIQELTKDLVGTHLNCKEFTPLTLLLQY